MCSSDLLPVYLRPAYGILTAAAVGLLPGFARRELRIPVAPLSDPFVVRPAAKAVLAALGLTLGSRPPALELAERSESARPGRPDRDDRAG
mgnify:CR=1 FL=1